MTRKRFVKLLMGQRVPRDLSNAVARRVAATGAPYSAVKIIFMRPNFDTFYIQVLFGQVEHLDLMAFLDSMEEIKAMLKKACRQESEMARVIRQMKPAERAWFEKWPRTHNMTFSRPIKSSDGFIGFGGFAL